MAKRTKNMKRTGGMKNTACAVRKDLGKIMEDIRQPCEGVFGKKIVESGSANSGKCESRQVNDSMLAETAAGKEKTGLGKIGEDIRQPCEGVFEDKTGENTSTNSSKCESRQADDSILAETVAGKEKTGLGKIGEDIRQPCEGLFEDNKQRKGEGAEEKRKEKKEETVCCHDNVKEVLQKLLQEDMILCINGEKLFIRKDGIYTAISYSAKSEIMYLKMLIRKYHWELKPSEYKAVLRELKTEPDIWVENIEKINGGYNIDFCGGGSVSVAEGEFDDYMVQGQMQIKRKPYTEGIALFVRECCEFQKSGQSGSSELFHAYQEFMNEIPDYLDAKQKQFVSFLKKEYGLMAGSTGKYRVLKGICLKNGLAC